MTNEQDVTLGEVYRLCLDIRTEQKAQIERVSAVEKGANDRITALERDAVRIKTIWLGVVIVVGVGIDWLKKRIGLS